MEPLTRYEGFIARIAKTASRLYRGSFSDQEDYSQIGRIAYWNASANWNPCRGDFPRYARVSIAREIMGAAIATHYALSAPIKVKRLAIKVNNLLLEGLLDHEIRRALRIDDKKLQLIKRLFIPTTPASLV